MIGTLSGRAQKQIPIIWRRVRRGVASGPEKQPDRGSDNKIELKKLSATAF
jgi:hypothetical protein